MTSSLRKETLEAVWNQTLINTVSRNQ